MNGFNRRSLYLVRFLNQRYAEVSSTVYSSLRQATACADGLWTTLPAAIVQSSSKTTRTALEEVWRGGRKRYELEHEGDTMGMYCAPRHCHGLAPHPFKKINEITSYKPQNTDPYSVITEIIRIPRSLIRHPTALPIGAT